MEEKSLNFSNNIDNLDNSMSNDDNFKIYINITPTYLTQQFKPPRIGKNLLVLDIDHTIYYEKKSTSRSWSPRPFLHDFLKAVNEFYDIVIWSATERIHLIRKMVKMNLHENIRYNIMFYLDIHIMEKTAPNIADSNPHHLLYKPLQTIWRAFPEYCSKNSVLVDDNPHNFFAATRNGIEISKYKGDDRDKELKYLEAYLIDLAKTSKDFTEINHSKWRNNFLHNPTKSIN